jgi:adenylate cyclase
MGDIIVDGDDIFGDGVNVAARLQEIATPGGICVSSRVHEDIRDCLDTAFDDGGTLGTEQLQWWTGCSSHQAHREPR